MRHLVVIETAENEYVPSTNPTTADLISWLTEAIEVRQGTRKAAASHVWWMRDARIDQLARTMADVLMEDDE